MAGFGFGYGGQGPDYQGLWKKYQQGPDSWASGNRLYNGVSTSPQSGPTDNPMGYDNRENTANMKRAFLMKQLTQGGF